MQPKIGDRVFARPAPGLKVQYEDIYNRFLPDEGQEVTFNEWWFRRYRDGSVLLSPVEEIKTEEKPKRKKD